jgi:uncharacterized Zn finger protein
VARFDHDYYSWRPYVSRAERRRQAARAMQKRRKAGHTVLPIEIAGRKIATTFWGTAWCDNLERYSDYENRLPRGRTYVRNGSVIDLQVASGEVQALVSGSEIYKVTVKVRSVAGTRWKAIRGQCAGGIDSLVELLQGRFSKAVMEHLCKQGTGLFPTPKEIEFSCSCPDWASMCKHVAAVLYGIGTRLDQQPELLFRLRQVDERDLLAHGGRGVSLSKKAPAASKVLQDEALGEVFGVDLVTADGPGATAPAASKAAASSRRSKTVGMTKSAKPAKRVKAPVAVRERRAAALRDVGANPPEVTRIVAARPERPSAGVRGLSAAQRKAVSERMTRYWEARRRG